MIYKKLTQKNGNILPSNKEEGYNIIAQSLLRFIEELKYPQAIKNFDKKSFNNELRAISLILLAYTNSFLSYVKLVCTLKDR